MSQTQSNVDPQEVQQFNAIAAQWWDPKGSLKPLHDLNPLRIQFIKEQAVVADKMILDIGCGGGLLTEALAKDGGIMTGIDMAADVIAVAIDHAKQQNLHIDYQQISAESYADLHPATYDSVICLELLEHVPRPEELVRACAALAKPGGNVFFSTLNRTLKSYLFAIIGAEYILRLLPQGTHDYQKFIRPSE